MPKSEGIGAQRKRSSAKRRGFFWSLNMQELVVNADMKRLQTMRSWQPGTRIVKAEELMIKLYKSS